MGFSRQEYWSGLPFPSPGDLPDPGIEPRSPALPADSLPSEPPGNPKQQLKQQGDLGENTIPLEPQITIWMLVQYLEIPCGSNP